MHNFAQNGCQSILKSKRYALKECGWWRLALASRVKKTQKRIETEFVLDMPIEEGLIARFRMFEDSHAVSDACASIAI